MSKYIAGIDPGKLGAIVVINQFGCLKAKYVIPLKDKNIDIKELCGIFAEIKLKYTSIVFLEKVHSIFGVNKGSMFVLGECLGIIEGILTALEFEWEFLTPKQWQGLAWKSEDIVYKDPNAKRKIKDTKATSLNCVQRLFPGIELLYGDNEKNTNRRTVQNSGLVDALLIAYSQTGELN